MKTKTLLLTLVTIFGMNTLSFADSPLTSTPFSNAYKDIEIVIKASKELLELVATTGEPLNVLGILPSRGKEDSSVRPQKVQIKQQFDLPQISVQATFERSDQEKEIYLNISLFDEKNEEFIPGIEITITGQEAQDKVISDKNGDAIFKIKDHGDYQILFESGKDEIARLNVSIIK